MNEPATIPAVNIGPFRVQEWEVNIPVHDKSKGGIGFDNKSKADTLQHQWLHVNKNTSWSPEQLLMAAVLEDAIACYHLPKQPVLYYKSGRRKTADKQREAKEWLFDPDDTWNFSFEMICESLNLEPSAVRREIK